jgi:hypothetical protein
MTNIPAKVWLGYEAALDDSEPPCCVFVTEENAATWAAIMPSDVSARPVPRRIIGPISVSTNVPIHTAIIVPARAQLVDPDIVAAK